MANCMTAKQFIDTIKDPKLAEQFANEVLALLKPKKEAKKEVKPKEEAKKELKPKEKK